MRAGRHVLRGEAEDTWVSLAPFLQTRGDLTALCSSLRRGVQREAPVSAPWDRAQGTQERHRAARGGSDRRALGMWLYQEGVKRWDRLPAGVVDSPSPAVFKRQLGNVLMNML